MTLVVVDQLVGKVDGGWGKKGLGNDNFSQVIIQRVKMRQLHIMFSYTESNHNETHIGRDLF